jgi:hypothetical protein
MRLIKEHYSIQRQPIKNWLDSKPDCDLVKEASSISVGTGCPILVVVEFIMEIKGETTELLSLRKRLLNFYNVDRVE